MSRKNIFFIMIALLAGAALFGADEPLPVNEEMAVELALAQNLSLQSSGLDRESAKEAADSSWNVLLPDFSASAGLSRSDSLLSESGSTGSWGVNGALSAELVLNASSALSVKSTKLGYQSQILSYETGKAELIVNVKKQYFYLLAYKENLALQERNLDLAQKRWEQSKTNFSNGLASELTVMEARNSYESLKPSYLETKTDYATQLMSFKSLLGLDLDRDVDVEGSLEIVYPDLNREDLIQAYLMNRLDIQTASKNVETLENQLTLLQTGNMAPSLILSAGWSNSAPDAADPVWSDTLSCSATLSLPLNGFIPGSSERVEIHDGERALEQARLNLEDTIQSAEQDIRTILMELEGDRENIEITALNVELAQKTFEMTETAYHSGSKEVLDVEDAQNNLLEANQDLLLSRYNYLTGLLDLEYALNADLKEINSQGGTK